MMGIGRYWIIAMFMALGVAGCLLPPGPPPPPQLGALPEITDYDGTDCLTVLVIGDSIAKFVGERIGSVLDDSGRCADVVQAAKSGSAVVDWLPGGDFDVEPLLADWEPDVVFAFFVGNESFSGLKWSNPNWGTLTQNAALEIVDLVPSDVALYWGLPAKATWRCEWGALTDQRWAPWHAWIRDTLPVLRPSVHIVDWRTTFGGDTYYQAFKFADGVARDVRLPDCVHFSVAGADIATTLVVAAMQGEWTVAPPEVTTTTTSTEPSSTTTTSTSSPSG